MTPPTARRRPGLLAYLDPSTIRELPPWIRRFLARCHPKRVVRVPLALTGQELLDRDRTIRHEHWLNRQAGRGWRESARLLARRYGISYVAVEHIVRASKLTPESNSTQGVAKNVTTGRHVRGPE